MVQLHDISPGDTFKNLIVKVHSVDGKDEGSKPKDPVYLATVKDASGYATLVYRDSNNCKPSNVKRGKVYSITGRHESTLI